MADAEILYDHYFLKYATYVVKNRAIPEIDDGLKPVQRRILHTLFEIDDGKYHKVANVVGQTMQFHPHGDQSIFSSLVSLANKNIFIDKQGNFGSVITGGPASAARYIECRVTPFAREVLLSPDITKYVETYDGRKYEPVVFPAKIPVALILGVEGIAVGMSTRILPHNPIEVMEAQISHLKGESFNLFPDFPTGGIMDLSEYNDGNGRVYARAVLESKEDGVVLIRELPFGETTESAMKSIEVAARMNHVPITQLTDYSTNGVEIEIRSNPGTKANDIVPGLYAFTCCEVAIDAKLLIIIDGSPQVTTVSEMIRHSTDRLLAIIEAELKIEESNLHSNLRAKKLEQIFIENRIYKAIEDVKDIESVYSVIRSAIVKYSTVSTINSAIDRDMNDLNGASLEIRESVRSLLTIIYRSLDFESYGPSREIIARNLDIIRNGSLSCRRLVESLLSAIRDDLIFAENIVGLENMVDMENITQADIDQLLDIPLYRISGYGIDRSEEEIRKIEAQLRSVKYKLNSLSSCAIEFLEQLIRTYREKYPRRSKVKLFAPIEKRVAAPKDLIFRYDKESGYLGYNIDSGVELFNISLFDRVAIVRSGGIVGIHDTLDKMYVDLDILYCAPEQKGLVFTIAYQDLEGFFYIKRFSLDRCRINQLYELVPGNSSLIAFTVEVDPVIILSCKNTQQGEEIKQYLESSAFSIRSHRARGDRIETAQYSNIKFAKR